ncbi:MarR family winged helix-turn-helix transcriptional regulator [Nocardia caishijiensis]|uniref:MarR family winged helix-turn-helix transcriptional regulator n=1 Tax=Nocardia caishijiensis TaxID=184756 RepID=UPI00082CB2F7|nr:MarR family winged helix-turn-helix transcriptional regulator [Nocardia caishijiensis]
MTDDLDSVERRAWSAVVTLAMRVPSVLDSRLQREFGLTHFEYRVLALLRDSPGHRMRLSMLAARGHGSISRVSHVVSKLERVGLVRRVAAPSGRGVDAVLTPSGLDKVVEATPDYLVAVRALVLDGLDETQKAELAVLAEKLSHHLIGMLGGSSAGEVAG